MECDLAFFGELKGIGKQVLYNLLKTLTICENSIRHIGVDLNFELEVLFFSYGLKSFLQNRKDLGKEYALGPDLQLSCLYF